MDPNSRSHIKFWARLQGECQLSHDLVRAPSEIKVKQRKYFDPGDHVPTATTSLCLKRNNKISGVLKRPIAQHFYKNLYLCDTPNYLTNNTGLKQPKSFQSCM
jgi:hypothetical protein